MAEKCQRYDCGLYGSPHWRTMCAKNNCGNNKFTTTPTQSITVERLKELEDIEKWHNPPEGEWELSAALGRAEAQVAELRKDRERLDWICNHVSIEIGAFGEGEIFVDVHGTKVLETGKTPREAIDNTIQAMG